MRLLVIGGSDAGVEAARRARELDPTVEVTLLVADAYPNFSICGLPYYLSGDVADWRALAHRTTADLEQAGLRLRLEHTAQAIDPTRRQVVVTDPGGADHQLDYDQLVVATGAVPVRPPIDGLDLDGVHMLHTMADTLSLHHALTAGAPPPSSSGVATSAWRWPRRSPPAACRSRWWSRPQRSCPPSTWSLAGCWARNCDATASRWSMTSPSRRSAASTAGWW